MAEPFSVTFTRPVHGVRIFVRDGQFRVHGVNERGEVIARAEQPVDALPAIGDLWPVAIHGDFRPGELVYVDDVPIDPNAGIPSA